MLFQSWHGAVYYEIVRVVGFITQSIRFIEYYEGINLCTRTLTESLLPVTHSRTAYGESTKKLVKLYILKVKLFVLSKFLSNLPLEVEALA